MTTTIGIIETGVANIASVTSGLQRLDDVELVVVNTPRTLDTIAALVLPGVGSFASGMQALRDRDLVAPLIEYVHHDRPLLAICLGLQLLCKSSDEAPALSGLGLINAHVASLAASGVRTPHLGWNAVTPSPACRCLTAGDAYFANSFGIKQPPEDLTVTWCDHGGPFVAGFERGSILACQFHPELSGSWGAGIVRRWAEAAREALPC